MILNAQTSPQRFPRAFQKWTKIQLQVRGGATIYYAHEQGEAANQNDGMQLTQASTNPPYDCWWKGDFWYSANAANSPLNIEVIAEADSGYHP
jgi:hypothetical protein